MYCSVHSCLDSMVFGEIAVNKQVRHRGLGYHNLLHKHPAEIDSIDDIHARRVEPLGDKGDLKDRYRGYCRHLVENGWAFGTTTRLLAKCEMW